MQLITVKIDKPDSTNFILGQTHFIKSVEDIHEALVGAVPGLKFGLAFCEASGKCLVRWSGTDAATIELARKNAADIAAGHSFIIFLGDGFYPLNVLNTLKMVPEVCRIFLRHRQSHRGGPGRDGTGARHPGRGGWILSKRHRGRERYSVAEELPASNRLQALNRIHGAPSTFRGRKVSSVAVNVSPF